MKHLILILFNVLLYSCIAVAQVEQASVQIDGMV